MKKHTLRFFFIRILLTVLVISSIQLKAFAEELTSTKKVDETVVQTNSVENTEPQVGELIDERTANTKTFYNGDGKYTEKVYFEPVNMKEPGETNFEEISPDLVKDNTTTNIITTENTAIDTEFLKTMSNGKYANFSYKGHSMSLSLLQAAGEDKTTLNASDVDAKFVENTNKIVHEGVFPQIDLQNYTFNQNTKEDLVLHQYDGYHIFTFNIQTDLKATIDEDGNIQMKDDEDKKIFELPKPFMSDSNINEGSGEAVTSDKVSYDIEEIDGGYKLRLNADPNWLASPDRVFPVFIDPTTSVTDSSDTFVMSAYPTTNYSSTSSKWDSGLGAYILKIGNYDSTTGTCYAFLNQGLPANLTGLTITSASFNAYVKHSASSSATGIWLDRITGSWSNSSVTWDTKPSSTNIATTTVGEGQWANFDITNTVKSWLSGSLTNYGLKLHENGNGSAYWKKIISTSNSDNNPYISVNYTIPTPDSPTGKAYSYGDSTNSGYVDLNWDAVPGATSYKVLIFNGNDYDEFSVGNVTSWSTKGRKIWPSPSEIASGIYTLHHVSTDGGVELPNDPSALYKKNGNKYPTNTNYWFRIKAIYPLGESAQSDPPFKPTIPNLKFAEMTSVNSFTRGTNGYIDLSWKPVPGATGYKFLMYNGKAFESLDIGNVTSWTTKDKKYWPKPTESYDLHLDNTKSGDELAIDPSIVYQKANPNYKPRYYVLKIVPYNANGETVQPAASYPYIPLIPVPSPPTGRAYTNLSQSNSGYVNLSWDKISGATGYKVWVYNGKDYESYDVGDVDNWTTQNKGIWPSQSEIDGGMKNLHHPTNPDDPNYGGVELPLEPSKLYAKNGTTYATSPYYYFRISAYNTQGETVYSTTYFRTVIGEAVPFLGTEDYWSLVDVPYGKVNVATGNLVVDENDFSIPGRGPGLHLNRTYNSLSESVGLFGTHWHSDVEMSMVTSTDQSKVSFNDEDGTLHVFTKEADGSFKAPTGVYLELTEDSNIYLLKDTDQSTIYFSKTTGRITQIKDRYGNTLTYTYDSNGKLTTMTDASNRTLTFEYNSSGLISSVTGPDNHKVSYTYQDGFLTSVTQSASQVTSYEYEDGNLVKVFEPNHTAEKPVIDQFVYDETKNVIELLDPKHQSYRIDYDQTNHLVTLTSPKGSKNQYTYNDAANPTKIIEDVDGLNITTTFNYVGNNLVETTDPNDEGASDPTEKYTYDGSGNILTSTDTYGTETYKYNQNNDRTSVVDTEGDKTTIAYDDFDAVSETNQTGKTSSIANYQKDTNGNSNGNLLESSYSLATSTNLLLNNSFENDLTSWSTNRTNDTGTLTIDSITANGLTGTKSLKLSAQSTSSAKGFIAATQQFDIEANKQYTLSGLIKTDVSKGNAFFNVLVMDANGTAVLWTDNRYSQITGKRNWTERQLSFKTPANAKLIRVYLEIEHYDPTASGSAWFDQIQLEKGDISSSYNPILNSSFNGTLTNWTGTGGAIDTTNGFEDSNSLKVERTATTNAASEYKQTFILGQTSSDESFDITLTGLSKADNVIRKGTVSDRDYAIVGKVTYTDNSTNEFVANFPIGTQDWNRAAIKIPAIKIPETKRITKIEVSTLFKGNYTGTVWFDGLRLLKGAIVTKNEYEDDAKNYVTKREDELGNTISATFDKNGNQKTETDAKGNTINYQYDLSDRLSNLSLENGTSISYKYDQSGNVLSKTIEDYQGKKQTFTYFYDAINELTETVGPLNEKSTNEYDAAGNLVKVTLPNGNIITNVYDGADRIKSVSFNDEKTYEYNYDKNGNELSVKYLSEGRTKSRTFDEKDRVIKQEDRGATQEWIYPIESDELSQFKVNHDSFNQQLTYQYNNLDQEIFVNDGEHSYRFDYDERGNVRTYTAGNGAGTSYKFDDRGNVQQIVVGNKDGLDILDETYTYDKNGNRTSIEYADDQQISYEYGNLDQLKKESLKDGTIKEYTYDGFGNRTAVKETKNGLTNETTAKFNLNNQLIDFGSVSILYDENGNRKEDGDYIYKWNEQGQLESITRKGQGSPFAIYRYDELDRRIEKIVDGNTTKYYYDGDSINVLYETDNTGAVLRSYIYSTNGQRLAMKTQGQLFYYHYNAHGDVIALTDQSGQIVASYEYDAWGNVIKSDAQGFANDNPFGYAGYMYDKETKLYYLIARYYQPETGVFLSLDPEPGEQDDVITQNGYTYVSNNPINLADCDGKANQQIGPNEGGGGGAYRGPSKVKTYKPKLPKPSNKVKGSIKPIKSVKLGNLPAKVQEMYGKYSKSGWKGNVSGQTKGTKAGGKYENDNLKLPSKTKSGKRITYKEFDVNNKKAGQKRDDKRFVKGSNGKIYYTPDHYGTFQLIQ